MKRLPGGSVAIPPSEEIENPSGILAIVVTTPSGVIFRIFSVVIAVSATYRLPDGSMQMALGPLNLAFSPFPSAEPLVGQVGPRGSGAPPARTVTFTCAIAGDASGVTVGATATSENGGSLEVSDGAVIGVDKGTSLEAPPPPPIEAWVLHPPMAAATKNARVLRMKAPPSKPGMMLFRSIVLGYRQAEFGTQP
ncbi:hypothetical protein D3C72_1178100 [compost metagenome]